MVLITELEGLVDKEMYEERGRIGRIWGVGVNEDLSMEERSKRWKIVKAVRKERAKGRYVEMTNRELWVKNINYISGLSIILS